MCYFCDIKKFTGFIYNLMVHIKTPQVALPQLWWNCFNTNQV